MSSRDCNSCSNLLRRDGTSQKQRLFEEQQPNYVSVDERSYLDLIEFALRYSTKVQFWDVFNRRSGDWLTFMENSQASLYTEIANTDLKAYQTAFDVYYNTEFVDANATRTQIIGMITDTFALATLLDGWLSKLNPELDLTAEIKNIIQRQAAPLIATLIEYDKGAEEKLKVAPVNPYLSGIAYTSLSDIWSIDLVNGESNLTIFGTGTIPERGVNAKRHFRVLFVSMLDVLQKLTASAEENFDELLVNYGKHEPHFALFLAFIQLFKYAQDHINEFTDKHLDFYYREVLQLSEKAAVPDSVHLVLEPAKNIEQKKLEKGTEFKAGKDDTGIEIEFETDAEIVINKAKVTELKSIYLDRGKNTQYIQTIYAANQANTVDGNGKAFADLNAAWEPFGKTQVKDGVVIEAQTMSTARVGFGIASPELILGEGQRKLTVTLYTDITEFAKIFGSLAPGSPKGLLEEFLDVNTITVDGIDIINNEAGRAQLLAEWLSVRLTGEKNWINPDNLGNAGKPLVSIDLSVSGSITFELTLSREQGSIVAYSNDVHGGNYDTNWPVMEVLFDQQQNIYGVDTKLGYEFLKDLRITSIKIDCDVTGVLNLKIGNDAGALDATKPCSPFTSNPQVGSNFYIGSPEVFGKRLTYLSIELDWKGVPESNLADYYALYRKSVNGNATAIVANNGHFTAQLKILEDYGWKDLSIAGPDDQPRPLHQSSALALKQTVATLTAPFTFLLMALWTAATTLALEIKELAIKPIRKQLTTENFVNLFRYNAAQNSTEEESDARLPQTIEVQSKDNDPSRSYESGYKNNFDLLTVDENSEDRYKRDPFIDGLEDYTEGTKRGYIKLELINDFFHAAYGRILTERAIGRVAGVPNTPYTPELYKVSLNYKSTFELNYDANLVTPITWENRIEQFYHITPFSEIEVLPSAAEKSLDAESQDVYYSDRLLPRLHKDGLAITADGRPETRVDIDTGRNVNITLEETGEGSLLIGIEEFTPPKMLSLLFQFKEGTEDNDLEVPAVEWCYLSNDQWVAFKTTEIVSDETNGLINSGIINFSMPDEATNNNKLLTNGLHWLRARIGGNSEAFSDLINVHAQAVKASYVADGNDPYRLNTPIPESTISKLLNKDFEIKTISQPYPSFDGRIQEQKSEYYTRVAERLRHKQRGITIRDYEHLVLEKFPEIYKTKCINHTSKYSEYAPGNVSVVVIPYFKNQNEKNPFELKVSKAKLNKIRKFLVKLNSPFVELDVRNPKYETIQVAFGVEFHIGYDRTFYEKQLNEEIKEFISPWAFGKEEDVIFGGKINRSTILNFIEERTYVDYVTHFLMFHKEDENKAPVSVLIAEGTTASSVLASALNHIILPADCDATILKGPGDYSFDHDSYNDSYN